MTREAPVSEILDLDEQTFFEDPALDRAFGVVMALATEVYVLRNHQRALERLLEEGGILEPGALEVEPADAERLAEAKDREEFTKGLMINLLGKQQSRGAK
ncbi:MAG: hypothetical protein VYE18_06970 [Pseudomonadota bacterium]|nr:hypothetical protein [Pseudomonadota bacterium]